MKKSIFMVALLAAFTFTSCKENAAEKKTLKQLLKKQVLKRKPTLKLFPVSTLL